MTPPPQPDPAEALRRRRRNVIVGGIAVVVALAAVGLLIPRGYRADDVDTRVTACFRPGPTAARIDVVVEARNSSPNERRVSVAVEVRHPDGRLLGTGSADLGEVPGRGVLTETVPVAVTDPPDSPECRVAELSVV